jgi:hypothetical protein
VARGLCNFIHRTKSLGRPNRVSVILFAGRSTHHLINACSCACDALKTKKQATRDVCVYLFCPHFFPRATHPLACVNPPTTIRFNDTQRDGGSFCNRAQTRMTAITQSLCFSLSPVKMILPSSVAPSTLRRRRTGPSLFCPLVLHTFGRCLSLCTSRSAGDKSRVGEIKRKKRPPGFIFAFVINASLALAFRFSLCASK